MSWLPFSFRFYANRCTQIERYGTGTFKWGLLYIAIHKWNNGSAVVAIHRRAKKQTALLLSVVFKGLSSYSTIFTRLCLLQEAHVCHHSQPQWILNKSSTQCMAWSYKGLNRHWKRSCWDLLCKGPSNLNIPTTSTSWMVTTSRSTGIATTTSLHLGVKKRLCTWQTYLYS